LKEYKENNLILMAESPPKLRLSLPVNEQFSYWQKLTTLRTAFKRL